VCRAWCVVDVVVATPSPASKIVEVDVVDDAVEFDDLGFVGLGLLKLKQEIFVFCL
jgi:hypothetical protein